MMSTERLPDLGIAPSGFRLPAELELGAVRIQVADLERSVRFYSDVIGLQEIERRGDVSLLGARDGRRPLFELREKRGIRSVPPSGHLGLFHIAILLPDRAALGRFVKHIAELGLRIGSADHLVSEAVYLNDPDGLGLEVYSDRPRRAWQHEGRQVVMATEPLDIRGVVEAAGTEQWNGAPSGTTIGHVHLRVGDLEDAEAFYHEALGFDKIVWTYPGALFLSAGGYHHHLGMNTWARRAHPASQDEARLLEWTIRLPDESALTGAADSLSAAGYETRRDADAVATRDPWGTALRLVAA